MLLNMCFNLGLKGLLGFNNTLAFIAARDWERAANGMLASKWAKQVGFRAIELSEINPNGGDMGFHHELTRIQARIIVDDTMREVYRAIYTALESCLYLIGSLIAIFTFYFTNEG